jgi:hypothetical protein
MFSYLIGSVVLDGASNHKRGIGETRCRIRFGTSQTPSIGDYRTTHMGGNIDTRGTG